MPQLAYIVIRSVASSRELLLFAAVSLIFAGFGKIVRGVTAGGAVAGAAVCFVLLWAAGIGGFAALLSVFLLTWACTRVGYAQKQRLGTAETRTGRDALQVLANLGIAAGCGFGVVIAGNHIWLIAVAAALAEAAADTVASEIGQAAGGEPRLITSGKTVPAGSDGAITVVGTSAGAVAAMTIAAVCWTTGMLDLRQAIIGVGAGVAGMIADSLLGATIERRGLIGNNGVNFISTAIAAVVSLLILLAN